MSLEYVTAFIAGFFSFPVLMSLIAFSIFFVATFVESAVLGLLFLVVSSLILAWAGVAVVPILLAHWALVLVAMFGYLPSGYYWGMHFKLPRSARKDAERVKARIEELKPEFISKCKEFMKAVDATAFFVGVPLVEKIVKNDDNNRNRNRNTSWQEESRGQNVSPELQATLLADLNNKVIPNSLEQTFKKYLDENRVKKTGAWRYKDKIFSWILFWPWSVIGYLATEFLYDMFTNFCTWVSNQWLKVWHYLVGIVTRAIDKAYADAGIDHLVEEEKKR